MRMPLNPLNPLSISLAAMTAISNALHHHITRAAAQHSSIPPTRPPKDLSLPPGPPFHLLGLLSGTQMLRKSVRLFRGAGAMLAPANRKVLHDILTAKHIGRIQPTASERLEAIKLILESAGNEGQRNQSDFSMRRQNIR